MTEKPMQAKYVTSKGYPDGSCDILIEFDDGRQAWLQGCVPKSFAVGQVIDVFDMEAHTMSFSYTDEFDTEKAPGTTSPEA